MEATKVNKQILEGTVVSDKMTKTVVVKVTISKAHPKYHKRYTSSKKYKAHSETGEFHVGDVVEIESVKPISREKHWKVIRKIK